MASYGDTYGQSNSGSPISFESMAGEGVDEIECENCFPYARPIPDTQPPDPDALLGPARYRYRYSWPGGQNLQQNAAAADSQTSLSVAAVSSGDSVRIETGLRSLADQFRQIEDSVSNLHTAIDWLTTCTSGFNITTPQQETPLGASGPYAMADVRIDFWEAKKCEERDFSTSTAQCLGQTLTTLEAQQSPHKDTPSSRQKQGHTFLDIQQCPAYFTLDDDSAITKVTTSCGVGVVWSIRLLQRMSSNNSQQIPTETTATVYSGRLLACPNCTCLMQLGAQIEIKNFSSGVAVDLRIKRLDIVRSNQLFRHNYCSYEIKNYYITIKLRFGDNVSRQTFWKFTV